jgi:hypothetical protein
LCTFRLANGGEAQGFHMLVWKLNTSPKPGNSADDLNAILTLICFPFIFLQMDEVQNEEKKEA